MGDLNSKRGRIQGSAAMGNGEVEIVASVPTSEIMRYAIDLRSMTGGRGRFSMKHSHYDPVPAAPRRQDPSPGRTREGLSFVELAVRRRSWRNAPSGAASRSACGDGAVGERAAAQFADAVGADALAQLALVGAEVPEHELEIARRVGASCPAPPRSRRPSARRRCTSCRCRRPARRSRSRRPGRASGARAAPRCSPASRRRARASRRSSTSARRCAGTGGRGRRDRASPSAAPRGSSGTAARTLPRPPGGRVRLRPRTARRCSSAPRSARSWESLRARPGRGAR